MLGVDVSGEVVEVGEAARRFSIGDHVYAYTGVGAGGGYGELAAVAEESLARVPSNLGLVEAGSVPGVGATAYEAFTVHAPLGPGMRVFINGAAGGVGTYAIQVAKTIGCHVTGTCSTAKADLVSRLGAEVVDYTTRAIPSRGRAATTSSVGGNFRPRRAVHSRRGALSPPGWPPLARARKPTATGGQRGRRRGL